MVAGGSNLIGGTLFQGQVANRYRKSGRSDYDAVDMDSKKIMHEIVY